MRQFEQVGSGARPPWWRTVPSVLAVAFLTLLSAVFSPAAWSSQHGGSGGVVLVTGLALLAAVMLPLALAWRHRFPFVVTLGAAGASLALPIGNALPLFALAALIGRRRGPAVWWTTAAVALSSAWVTIADAVAQPRGASFWKAWLGPVKGDNADRVDLTVPEIVIIVALGLGAAIGAGLLARSRREAASASGEVATERAASGRLGDEVARRQERERIAREVHDGLGHRLSLLTLHAGALEANSAGDPRMAQSVRLIRQTAASAMDDLRSLLSLLREPPGAELPAVPLAELARVVEESFGAGQPLSSSIFVADPDTAHPALSRAVFRIVQELLTNARRHAPGQQAWLTVQGSPASGVTIEARNRFIGGWGVGPPGSSRGLAGIAERAELLGGHVSYGVQGEFFRVRVELPWVSADGQGGAGPAAGGTARL